MPTRRHAHTFTMRLKAEDSARLNKLADFYGVNASSLIRMVLKQEERKVASRKVVR